MQKFIILTLLALSICSATRTFQCKEHKDHSRDNEMKCPSSIEHVCATFMNNNQKSMKTYQNSCLACMDDSTMYYAQGRCEKYHNKARFCDPNRDFNNCNKSQPKVCGFMDDSKSCRGNNCKTYMNKCAACNDDSVWYYIEGGCGNLQKQSQN